MAKITKRYIITGSKNFPHEAIVEKLVTDLIMAAHRADDHVVIVHGACPTGADHYADVAAKKLQQQGYPVTVEEHPADWNGPHGRGAGHVRNFEMAKLGAARCIAFWDGKSPGTLSMIQKAVVEHIPVWICPA